MLSTTFCDNSANDFDCIGSGLSTPHTITLVTGSNFQCQPASCTLIVNGTVNTCSTIGPVCDRGSIPAITPVDRIISGTQRSLIEAALIVAAPTVIAGPLIFLPQSVFSVGAPSASLDVAGDVVIFPNATVVIASTVQAGSYVILRSRSAVEGSFVSAVGGAPACVSPTVSTQGASVLLVVAQPCATAGSAAAEGLSTGAIVGIAVGAAVVGIGAAVAIAMAWRWQRNRHDHSARQDILLKQRNQLGVASQM